MSTHQCGARGDPCVAPIFVGVRGKVTVGHFPFWIQRYSRDEDKWGFGCCKCQPKIECYTATLVSLEEEEWLQAVGLQVDACQPH